MSRQVIVSDTFDGDFAELLVAAMKYVRNPSSTKAHYDFVHARLHEYDTKINKAVNAAVQEVLGKK